MKRETRYFLATCVCAFGCLAAVRCDFVPGAVDSGTATSTGKLRVVVTDKPFPFEFIEEALLTITRVEVRKAGVESDCAGDEDCDDGAFCNGAESCNDATGECEAGSEPCGWDETCDEDNDECVAAYTGDNADDNGDDGDNDDGNSFVVIFQGSKTFNLLDLQNGRTDLLADSEVPAGTYTQMRLIVTEGSVKLEGREEPFLLRVPSGEQTGIKLHFTFEVEADQETTLLLDVNLSRAFRPIPGGHIDDPDTIRSFHFTPSVAMRLINLLDAGSISGRVVDAVSGQPLPGVSVTAFKGDDELTSTGTGTEGRYVVGGLPTGVYRLEFSLATYQDAEIVDVQVTAGETTELADVELTPIGP